MIQYEDTLFEPTVSMENNRLQNPNRIWKCPVCKAPYTSKNAMYDHMYDKHMDIIPEGMSAAQYAFNLRNNKAYGLCCQCRVNKTKWNEDAERYERFCGDACTQKYAIEAKRRMVEKYGKDHLLNDPTHQQKMMDSRKISGKYKFDLDNTEVPYMGTYEYDFLRHVDLGLGLKGSDVMRCPHAFEYEYEGEKHVYIPDYFLPNFNLIVEIKDGGDNPNMHHKIQDIDKAKESFKDGAMRNQDKYNFIKIVDKKYTGFAYMIRLIVDRAWNDPDFKLHSDNVVLIPE